MKSSNPLCRIASILIVVWALICCDHICGAAEVLTTLPSTVLQYPLDGNLNEGRGLSSAGSVSTGTPVFNANAKGAAGSALYLAKATTAVTLTIPQPSSLPLTSASRTWCANLYLDATTPPTSGTFNLVYWGTASIAKLSSITFSIASGDGQLCISQSSPISCISGFPMFRTWTHVCATATTVSTSTQVTLFVNGLQVATATQTLMNTVASAVTISASTSFSVTVSHFVLANSVLSDQTINDLAQIAGSYFPLDTTPTSAVLQYSLQGSLSHDMNTFLNASVLPLFTTPKFVTGANGKSQGALFLKGGTTPQSLTIPQRPSFPFNSDSRTWCAALYLDTIKTSFTNTIYHLLYWGSTSFGGQFSSISFNPGKAELCIYTGSFPSNQYCVGGFPMFRTWNHVCATAKPILTQTQVSLYVNGQQIGTKLIDPLRTVESEFTASSSNMAFDMTISHLTVHNSALDLNQINALAYKAGLGVPLDSQVTNVVYQYTLSGSLFHDQGTFLNASVLPVFTIPQYVTGPKGKALLLKGGTTPQQLTIPPRPSSPFGYTARTWCAALYLDTTDLPPFTKTLYHLLYWGSTSFGGQFSSISFNPGNAELCIYTGSFPSNQYCVGGFPMFRTWNHVCATAKPVSTQTEVSLFVNGQQIGTKLIDQMVTVDSEFTVASTSMPIDVTISHITLYNAALTLNEINTLALKAGLGVPLDSQVTSIVHQYSLKGSLFHDQGTFLNASLLPVFTTPQYAAGANGSPQGALLLKGGTTPQLLTIPQKESFPFGADPRTWCASLFLRTTATSFTSKFHHLLYWGVDGFSGEFCSLAFNPDTNELCIYTGSFSSDQYCLGGLPMFNTWVHVCATAKQVSTKTEVSLFGNGIQLGTKQITLMKTLESEFTVASSTMPFDTIISNIAIYNVALTSMQVNQLASSVGLGNRMDWATNVVYQYSLRGSLVHDCGTFLNATVLPQPTTPVFVNGTFGPRGALLLKGGTSPQSLVIAQKQNLPFGSAARTWCANFYLDTASIPPYTSAFHYLLFWGKTTFGGQFCSLAFNPGTRELCVYTGSFSSNQYCVGGFPMFRTWNHVCATSEPSSSQSLVVLYVNGQKIGGGLIDLTVTEESGLTASSSSLFDMTISQVSVYNVSLPLNQINALAIQAGPGLPLDPQQGNIVYQYSLKGSTMDDRGVFSSATVGPLVTAPVFVSGLFGAKSAVLLKGGTSPQQLIVPQRINLPFGSAARTWCASLYLDTTTLPPYTDKIYHLIYWGETSFSGQFCSLSFNPATTELCVFTGTFAADTYCVSGFPMFRTWSHVCATAKPVSSTETEVSLFVNGQQIGTNKIGLMKTLESAFTVASSTLFDVTMNHLNVFDTALSPNQVNNLAFQVGLGTPVDTQATNIVYQFSLRGSMNDDRGTFLNASVLPLFNTPVFVNGASGPKGALLLKGNTIAQQVQKLIVPQRATLPTGSATRTWCANLYLDTTKVAPYTSTLYHLLFWGATTWPGEFSSIAFNAGTTELCIYTGSFASNIYCVSGYQLIQTWTHVCATSSPLSSTQSSFGLFVNGIQVGSATKDIMKTVESSFTISSSTMPFDVSVSDLAVFNVALTVLDVAQLYTKVSLPLVAPTPPPSPLVLATPTRVPAAFSAVPLNIMCPTPPPVYWSWIVPVGPMPTAPLSQTATATPTWIHSPSPTAPMATLTPTMTPKQFSPTPTCSPSPTPAATSTPIALPTNQIPPVTATATMSPTKAAMDTSSPTPLIVVTTIGSLSPTPAPAASTLQPLTPYPTETFKNEPSLTTEPSFTAPQSSPPASEGGLVSPTPTPEDLNTSSPSPFFESITPSSAPTPTSTPTPTLSPTEAPTSAPTPTLSPTESPQSNTPSVVTVGPSDEQPTSFVHPTPTALVPEETQQPSSEIITPIFTPVPSSGPNDSAIPIPPTWFTLTPSFIDLQSSSASNILLTGTSYSAVHVSFTCLFVFGQWNQTLVDLQNATSSAISLLPLLTHLNDSYAVTAGSFVADGLVACPAPTTSVEKLVTINQVETEEPLQAQVHLLSDVIGRVPFGGDLGGDTVTFSVLGSVTQVVQSDSLSPAASTGVAAAGAFMAVLFGLAALFRKVKKVPLDHRKEFFFCLIGGLFGAHHFVKGNKKKGFLFLFTLGLLGVGWISDLMAILKPPQNEKLKSVKNQEFSAEFINMGSVPLLEPMTSAHDVLVDKNSGRAKHLAHVLAYSDSASDTGTSPKGSRNRVLVYNLPKVDPTGDTLSQNNSLSGEKKLFGNKLLEPPKMHQATLSFTSQPLSPVQFSSALPSQVQSNRKKPETVVDVESGLAAGLTFVSPQPKKKGKQNMAKAESTAQDAGLVCHWQANASDA